MVTHQEVERFKDVGKLDVLLTHDVPVEVDIQTEFVIQGLGRHFFKSDDRTLNNRRKISSAVVYTKPDYLFHGHYHLAYTTSFVTLDQHVVSVRGLDRDGFGKESFTVLDLKEQDGRGIN
jgi:hypothetical protein